MQVLQIEIVPEKTTGSGNESCVWRTHPGYQKRERELNEWRERKKRNKNAKHVKCKDVLRFICGSYETRVTFWRPCQDELRFSSPWDVICCQGKQKWSELRLRRLRVERYEHVDLQLGRQTVTENSQIRTVGLYNIELSNGEVHSLVVLCLAKWTSWSVMSAHCYRNYSVCVRLHLFSLEISFRGQN